MKHKITECKFDSRAALFDQLLADVTAGLSAAVAEQGRASMLLSGGTSPGTLYRMMAEQDLNWEKIWFGLTDERWVAPQHPDSNERLVRETVLAKAARRANFIGLKAATDDIEQGAVLSNQALRALPSPYDIVLLGMGLDGHMASLFPDSPDVAAALGDDMTALCHPIRRGPDETPRISMTRTALLNCREVKLLFFGAEKWAVYQQARRRLSDQQPVSHILNQFQTPVTVYWAP